MTVRAVKDSIVVFVVAIIFVAVMAPSILAVPPLSSSPETVMDQGVRAFRRGAFDQALAAWKAAAELYGRNGQIKQQSEALVQAAQAAQALGQLRAALQHLDLALSLAHQIGDQTWLATVLEGLGRTYLAMRQVDAAASYLDQALELARAQDSPALKAAVLNDLGILRASQSRFKDAFAAYTESASLAHTAGQPALAVRAQINAAIVGLQLKRPDEVRGLLETAQDEVGNFPPSFDKAHALVNIGLAYADLRTAMEANSDELLLRAVAALTDAVSISQQIGDARTQSYALGHLGHLYETEHRYDEALSLSRQAVFTAQSVNAPESLYRWQWQTGRILASLNRLDEALTAYRIAIHTLEPIRVEVALVAQGPSTSGQESVRPLYVEYADLLLNRAALMGDGRGDTGLSESRPRRHRSLEGR